MAPRDSQRNRTLDQQCTVTRPGVSYLASAHVVELLAAMTQHPMGPGAPAALVPDANEFCGVEGAVPHSIRGYLSSHLSNATMAFDKCCACSQKVIDEYRARRFDFLREVFKSPRYLEDLTGLRQWMVDVGAEN